MTLRSSLRFVASAAAFVLAVYLGIIAYQKILRFGGNFHVVVSDQLYRSAQLSPSALDDYIREYGIKTVLNLRGPAPDKEWYVDEKRVAESNGLAMIDFGMSATQQLTSYRAVELISTMKNAQKPILVHCLDGADRTGLVSVIYANQIAGVDAKTAEGQLTPLYGHFGIPYLSPTYAMDTSWENLKAFFAAGGK